MEDPARMICQPFFDLGMLVGGVVVGDSVDNLARRDGAFHSIEEFDEFLVGVLGHAAADDGAVEDVEGGEQGRGSVALVVMGHGSAFARLQRQTGLGAVESLDLALFVDGHDDGMGWQVHVEADDILDLGSEGRILGLLETVGLEAVRVPQALDGAQADADSLGHHTACPMGGLARRLATGQRQNLGDSRRREGLLAGFARLVAQQAIHSFLGEAPLPAPNCRSAGSGLARHVEDGQLVRRQKDDASPQDMLLRAVTITDNGCQSRAIVGLEEDADGLCHAPRIAWITTAVNPLFSSVH